ncbi:MAG: hypothetical protein MN733_28805 [Nitrososphaera sp.]|nr:hypothetical protein [Nitrososphaera sp.]
MALEGVTARLRWLNEPLDGNVEPLAEDEPKPINCRLLVHCWRFNCFSEEPYPGFYGPEELAEVLAENRELDIQYFGVPNPREVVDALDAQYDADNPDPVKIKAGLDVLKCVYDFTDGMAIGLEDVPESHPEYKPDMKVRAASYSEVCKAIAQAIRITEKFLYESKK